MGLDCEVDEAVAGSGFEVPEPVLCVLCLEELESDLFTAVLELVAGADCCIKCASGTKPELRAGVLSSATDGSC